jgi:tellurite resistance protein
MVAEVLLGSVLASAAGGAVYLVNHHRKEKLLLAEQEQERLALFREALVRELRGRRLSEFDFSEFVAQCEMARDKSDKIAQDVYQEMCRRVWADGIVTDDERKKLNNLSRALELDQETTLAIEADSAAAVYRNAVAAATADGVVTAAEAVELDSLRRSLGLSRKETLEITGEVTRDAYKAALRRIVRAGPVTDRAKDELAQLKQALLIRDDEARRMIRDDAEALYRECFTIAIQDGVVTCEEKATLHWLQVEAGLTDAAVARYKSSLDRIDGLAECRQGKLPSLRSSRLLESGEICHWDSGCQFTYQTARSQLTAVGELIVTSKQVIFSSPSKSFTFSPSRILNLHRHGHAVDLTLTSRQGAGRYYVEDPEMLQAVLIGVVRRHKWK